MAIYHLHMSRCRKGDAEARAKSILRLGRYAHHQDLVAHESGNLPGWAVDAPLRFWQAADIHERANGRACTEIEFSLPRELNPQVRLETVRAYVAQLLGERHAYTWAVKRVTAADGIEHPHARLIYCERTNDGIDRDPAQFFRRANVRKPERGGAAKSRAMNAKDFLLKARALWTKVANDFLEREGSSSRIDHRSYRAMGMEQNSLIGELEGQARRRVAGLIEARGEHSDWGIEGRERLARNGERLMAYPKIVLSALTVAKPTFSRRELERFVKGHTLDEPQYSAVMHEVLSLPELAAANQASEDGSPLFRVTPGGR